MRKLIASINMTLDGYCDHTAVITDDELHQIADELLRSVDTVLFGRVTCQLMESGWPPVVKRPTGIKSVNEFAVLIENIWIHVGSFRNNWYLFNC
jgi:dihydrofolate reductase